MYSISATNFKNISGCFLTKHQVNKNWISLSRKIIGSYLRVFTVMPLRLKVPGWKATQLSPYNTGTSHCLVRREDPKLELPFLNTFVVCLRFRIFVSVTMVGTINIQPNLRSGVLFWGEKCESRRQKKRGRTPDCRLTSSHIPRRETVISGLFAYF